MDRIKTILIGIAFAILTACTSIPIDTLNKRLAVFEIGYNQTLITIQLWSSENRFNDAQKAEIKKYVSDMSMARQAIYAAKDIGNLSDASTKLGLANQSLGLIRNYIKQMEAKGNESKKYSDFVRYAGRCFKRSDQNPGFVINSRNGKPRCFRRRVGVFT